MYEIRQNWLNRKWQDVNLPNSRYRVFPIAVSELPSTLYFPGSPSYTNNSQNHYYHSPNTLSSYSILCEALC